MPGQFSGGAFGGNRAEVEIRVEQRDALNDIERFESRVKALARTLPTKLGASLDRSAKRAQRFGRTLANTLSSQNVLRLAKSAGSRMAKTFVNAYTRGIRAARSIVKRATKAIFSLPSLLAGSVAGLFTISAIRGAASFDDTLRRISATSEEAAGNIGLVKRVAEQLGETTPRTAQDAAGGILALTQAGLGLKDTLTAIVPALNLAIAGSIDIGESAGIAAAAMVGFRQDASFLPRIMDQIIVGARSARTEIGPLGQAVARSAAGFRQIGQDSSTLTALAASLAQITVEGDEAGTSLLRLGQRLARGSAGADEFLKGIKGLSLSSRNFREGKVDVLEFFDTVSKGVDAGSIDLNRFSLILGDRGVKAFEAFRAVGADFVFNLRDQMRQASGETEAFVETLEGGPGGSLRRIESAFAAVKLSLVGEGSGLKGFLDDTLTPMVRQMARFVKIAGGVGGLLDLAGELAADTFERIDKVILGIIKIATGALVDASLILARGIGNAVTEGFKDGLNPEKIVNNLLSGVGRFFTELHDSTLFGQAVGAVTGTTFTDLFFGGDDGGASGDPADKAKAEIDEIFSHTRTAFSDLDKVLSRGEGFTRFRKILKESLEPAKDLLDEINSLPDTTGSAVRRSIPALDTLAVKLGNIWRSFLQGAREAFAELPDVLSAQGLTAFAGQIGKSVSSELAGGISNAFNDLLFGSVDDDTDRALQLLRRLRTEAENQLDNVNTEPIFADLRNLQIGDSPFPTAELELDVAGGRDQALSAIDRLISQLEATSSFSGRLSDFFRTATRGAQSALEGGISDALASITINAATGSGADFIGKMRGFFGGPDMQNAVDGGLEQVIRDAEIGAGFDDFGSNLTKQGRNSVGLALRNMFTVGAFTAAITGSPTATAFASGGALLATILVDGDNGRGGLRGQLQKGLVSSVALAVSTGAMLAGIGLSSTSVAFASSGAFFADQLIQGFADNEIGIIGSVSELIRPGGNLSAELQNFGRSLGQTFGISFSDEFKQVLNSAGLGASIAGLISGGSTGATIAGGAAGAAGGIISTLSFAGAGPIGAGIGAIGAVLSGFLGRRSDDDREKERLGNLRDVISGGLTGRQLIGILTGETVNTQGRVDFGGGLSIGRSGQDVTETDRFVFQELAGQLQNFSFQISNRFTQFQRLLDDPESNQVQIDIAAQQLQDLINKSGLFTGADSGFRVSDFAAGETSFTELINFTTRLDQFRNFTQEIFDREFSGGGAAKLAPGVVEEESGNVFDQMIDQLTVIAGAITGSIAGPLTRVEEALASFTNFNVNVTVTGGGSGTSTTSTTTSSASPPALTGSPSAPSPPPPAAQPPEEDPVDAYIRRGTFQVRTRFANGFDRLRNVNPGGAAAALAFINSGAADTYFTNLGSSNGYSYSRGVADTINHMIQRFSIPGFQHGGQFRVGGVGGPDSQLVAFRATPNETVTVTRPDQQQQGGGATLKIEKGAIVVNPAQGMDERQIADAVMNKIKRESARGKIVVFNSGVGTRRLT